jgi:hypothetical protein
MHTMRPAVQAGVIRKIRSNLCIVCTNGAASAGLSFFINGILDTALRFSLEWFEFNRPHRFVIQ